MKTRFSLTAFIIATLIHLGATSLLLAESERAWAEWCRTRVEADSLWVPICGWIVQPVAMLVSHYSRHDPLPASPNILAPPNPTAFILPWTLFVGVCFGFLVPRVRRWRH